MDVRDTLIDAVRSALADLGVEPVPDVVQLERPALNSKIFLSSVVRVIDKDNLKNPTDDFEQFGEFCINLYTSGAT